MLQVLNFNARMVQGYMLLGYEALRSVQHVTGTYCLHVQGSCGTTGIAVQSWTRQPTLFVKNLEMTQTTLILFWDNNSENPSPKFHIVHKIFQEHTTSHNSEHCAGITKILKCGPYQAGMHNIETALTVLVRLTVCHIHRLSKYLP